MELSANAKGAYPDWWQFISYAAAKLDAAGKYAFQIIDIGPAVADIHAQAGLRITPGLLPGLSSLFGIARTMEVKADRLTALPDDAAITDAHISEAPYSRPLAQQLASPKYQIRAEITYRAPDGTVVTQWGTGIFNNTPPATAGAMRDEARLQFARMLAKRDEQKNTGGELLSIGRTYLIAL